MGIVYLNVNGMGIDCAGDGVKTEALGLALKGIEEAVRTQIQVVCICETKQGGSPYMERAAAACGFYVAARQDRKVGAGGVAILCREGVSAVPVHCEEAHEEDGDLRVEVCAALVRWAGETWQVVCGMKNT